MKPNILRQLAFVALLVLGLLASGCDHDFHLSESEVAAYFNLFSTSADANNFIANSIVNQALDIRFNGTSIQSTNLVDLMRNYTTLGFVEGFNHQVQLDHLNSELQTQLDRWVTRELRLYTGPFNASARLTQLDLIRARFISKPVFTFRPDRQSVTFSFKVRLTINGTVEVNALDSFLDAFFGVNGAYPLSVEINPLTFNGEIFLQSPYADAGAFTLHLTAQPGVVNVTSINGSAVSDDIRDGVRNFTKQILGPTLSVTSVQRYDYFALTGLRLTNASAQAPSGFRYTYETRPEVARPMMHIVARGADRNIYHMRKLERGQDVQSTVLPFSSLGGLFEDEPALFASSTDQLELAATTNSFDLTYSHWQDETWSAPATYFAFGNPAAQGYRGKPAIVASAPGQVEIVVAGRTGGLWHMRRVNGVWTAPASVPLAAFTRFAAPPFRDPVAVISGNKVVLVFVDGEKRLLSMVFDMESGFWGLPTPILTQEQIRFAPAAAASGDGQIDLVYVGLSGTPYHRILNVQSARFPSASAQSGLNVTNTETRIELGVPFPSTVLSASPSLVASGYRQLELVARGTNNRLYHNHFVPPPSDNVGPRGTRSGWGAWRDLNGNFSGSLTFEEMSSFTAASTSSGKVVVASIALPSLIDKDTSQFVFYNTVDGDRFDVESASTLHWRGYEQAGNQRFVGQPALAVTDRQAELVYMSSDSRAIGGRLSERNTVRFRTIADPQMSLPPVDPVVVSSAPGKYDVIEVGGDGRLRHIRAGSHGALTTSILVSGGATFRTQPAVAAYGNGQLEVVATAQNNIVYHWRYQNGVWGLPVALTGTVISRPILVHLGAGQLVTLAVDNDHRLLLWAFTNGAWSNRQSIPTTGCYINPTFFGPMAASSWGEGSVDLALVDASGALYHGRIGPAVFAAGAPWLTPSRAFTSVGGILVDTPILTALSPTRISILAVGTDHSIYTNWSSPGPAGQQPNQAPDMVWGGFSGIAGPGLTVGGVARLGSNELIAAAIDGNGQVFISRSNGKKWLQFQGVLGMSPGTLASPPQYRPAITSFPR